MPKLGRRTLLAAGSAAVVLPAGPVRAGDYKEAPSLKEKVASGALPGIKDRLPENPLVIKPVERVGKYGGDWNHALVAAVRCPCCSAIRHTSRWCATRRTGRA